MRYSMGAEGEAPHHPTLDMTTFTLVRSETKHQPSARCTFQQYISEAGSKFVDVKMSYLYATGWEATMGKGDGYMSVRHAREFYWHLLEIGYTPA